MKTKPKKRYRHVWFSDEDYPDGDAWDCEDRHNGYVCLGYVSWCGYTYRWVFCPDQHGELTIQHLADILDFMRARKPEKP